MHIWPCTKRWVVKVVFVIWLGSNIKNLNNLENHYVVVENFVILHFSVILLPG